MPKSACQLAWSSNAQSDQYVQPAMCITALMRVFFWLLGDFQYLILDFGVSAGAKSHSFLLKEHRDRRRSSGLCPLHLASSHCLFCCLSCSQCSPLRSPPLPELLLSRCSPSSRRAAWWPEKLVPGVASGAGNNRGVFVSPSFPSLGPQQNLYSKLKIVTS